MVPCTVCHGPLVTSSRATELARAKGDHEVQGGSQIKIIKKFRKSFMVWAKKIGHHDCHHNCNSGPGKLVTSVYFCISLPSTVGNCFAEIDAQTEICSDFLCCLCFRVQGTRK